MTLQASSEPTRPRVLIADDHCALANELRALLEKRCEVIGIVRDGLKLLTEVSRLAPDVIVLDIGMPLLNGYDAAIRIRESSPDSKIVFLTMMADKNLAAAVFDWGSTGYVLKTSAASELLTAVFEVLEGRSYVTPRLLAENRAVRETRAKQASSKLTPRQQLVLQLLAEGKATTEIAQILMVSEKTVLFHKYQIMESLDLKSNADLVLFYRKNRQISS